MLDENSPKNGSPYTPPSSILPIVLDYFKTTPTSFNTVLVEWSTFSEKDNDFFTLERSIDGKHFEVITIVEGAGNSNKKLHYSFEDTNPEEGIPYPAQLRSFMRKLVRRWWSGEVA